MGLGNLFNKEQSLVAIDIGSTAIKLIELDLSREQPELLNIASIPVRESIFSGNTIVHPEVVAEKISALVESNGVKTRRAITCVPGPAVFTKKIKMPAADLDELRANIQFEAGNFIPHSIDAVHLDFHVSPNSRGSQYDVLVVAVKNEIVDALLESLTLASLETVILDVDLFALQNMLEFSRPDLLNKTVAIINIGARYSGLNICKNGDTIFTGDIPVGGKIFSDALRENLKISADEVEKLKANLDKDGSANKAARELIDVQVEQAAIELNRQLTFLWNASGADEPIERIILTGGGSLTYGLDRELSEKTGLQCERIDPLAGVKVGGAFDPGFLKESAPAMGVCLGLALRQLGDRIEPESD